VGQALSWGATGHEFGGIAIEKLTDDVPAFVRQPATLPEIAAMGRELDRSKGAGATHGRERDLGHDIDLTDDGTAMGIVPLDKLPVTREAYGMKLSAGDVDAERALRRGRGQFEVKALRFRHSTFWGTALG